MRAQSIGSFKRLLTVASKGIVLEIELCQGWHGRQGCYERPCTLLLRASVEKVEAD